MKNILWCVKARRLAWQLIELQSHPFTGVPGSCPTGTGSLFSKLLNCDTVDTFENLDLMANTMSQTLQPAARRRMSCGDGNHLHLTGDDARLGGT